MGAEVLGREIGAGALGRGAFGIGETELVGGMPGDQALVLSPRPPNSRFPPLERAHFQIGEGPMLFCTD